MKAGTLARDLAQLVAFTILVAVLAAVTRSGVVLNFIMMALYVSLMAQAWNLLGGFGGQFSFGHALFFGTGAYAQLLLQSTAGLNPWLALPLAMGGAALVAVVFGALSFRYGLRGSYFALVTLAFAEVFRICAVSANFTGGGVGLMLTLKEGAANMQFGDRRGYVALALALLLLAQGTAAWLRHSRFGAWLQAIRDNEDAARAIGVDPFRVKLGAIALSGALMGAAGVFYVQVFHYIDPGIAFGPHTSVEALVAAIVGGLGSLWGPVLGAVVLQLLADLTRNLFGELPGINMIVYGSVLVLIVMFSPRGLVGIGQSVRDAWRRGGRPASAAAPQERAHG